VSADPQIELIYNQVVVAIELLNEDKPDRAKKALIGVLPHLCRLTLNLTDAPTDSYFVWKVTQMLHQNLKNPMKD